MNDHHIRATVTTKVPPKEGGKVVSKSFNHHRKKQKSSNHRLAPLPIFENHSRDRKAPGKGCGDQGENEPKSSDENRWASVTDYIERDRRRRVNSQASPLLVVVFLVICLFLHQSALGGGGESDINGALAL